MNGFSIIVCTFNGGKYLPITTDYLAALKIPANVGVEVIVADNNSTDSTYEIALGQINKFGTNVLYKVIKEKTAGKINALISAIKTSRYDWVVICDDDNWLDANYLIEAHQLIFQFNDVGIFGGQSKIAVDKNVVVPDWFIKSADKYAIGKQQPDNGYITHKQNLWGAGSIILKSPLQFALQAVKPLLAEDRGEDSEICFRFVLMGYKMYYANELMIQHFMPTSRISMAYHNEFLEKIKPSRNVLNKYHQFIKYYVLNHKPVLARIKWPVYYGLSKFGTIKHSNPDAAHAMINLFTPFGKDSDFKSIKQFYKAVKFFHTKSV